MRILIVEDDTALCEMLAFHLEQEGYDVDACSDGDDGLRLAREQAYALVLLDRMLPVMNGIHVLSALRKAGISTPVLLLTALGTLEQRVEGLDAGADDYLVKPFDVEELLARVRALCRRPVGLDMTGVVRLADTEFDATGSTLQGPAGVCRLSTREQRLAEVFFHNPGQILPRQVLFAKVWGPNGGVVDGNLDSYVYFLRRHLLSVGSSLRIETVRGLGYQLEVPDA